MTAAATAPTWPDDAPAITNREFVRLVFGDAVPWFAAFVHYPVLEGAKKAAWKGAPLAGAWPRELDNPAANAFVSIGSVRDPAAGRVETNFAALHAVVLDDVGTKIDPATIRLPPSAINQTSQRDGVPNCQYWYFLDAPCTDFATAKRLTDGLVNAGFSDAGAKGVLRYARLPVGSNSKPEYGQPIPHALLHIDATARHSAQEIAHAFGLDLDTGAAPNAASGEHSGSGSATAELVRRIVTGENFHDATRDLAAKMITQGCAGGFVVNHVRGLLHAAPDRDGPRWRDRYDDVPALVDSAQRKFAPEPAAPEPAACLVDLHDLAHAEVPAPAHIIERLLPERAVTLLGAHGGTGKTLLALFLAVCVATGRAFLGHAVKRSRVILYSAEDGAAILRYRLRRILAHLGVDPAELDGWLFVLDMTQAEPVLYREERNGGVPTERYHWLAERVAEFAADVVVIDNASDTFDANLISTPRVRQFIRLLGRLVQERSGAVLLLAHLDKAAAKAGHSAEGYSGAAAWNNCVRSRLFLFAAEGGAVILEHQKANYGPKAEDMALHWQDGLLVPAGEAGDPAAPLIEFQRLRTVLRLIRDFNERGEAISTATQAPNNAYRLMHRAQTFPPRLGRSQLFELLRNAERQKLIERELYKNAARVEKERWTLTDKGRAECFAFAPGLDESNAQEVPECQSAEN